MPASGFCRTGSRPVSGSTPSQLRLTSQFSTNTANASVVTARYRPGMRSAGIPMSTATAAPTSTPERDGDAPRHVVQAETTAVADQLHGDEAADRREAELAERQLARPPAEDRERATGDREDQHARPEERLRRLRGERGDEHEHDENARRRRSAARWRTAHGAPDPFGQRLGPARQLPRPPSSAAARAVGASVEHDDERRDEQPEREDVRRRLRSTFCWRITSTMPSAMPTGTVSQQDPHAGDHGDEERLHQHAGSRG